MDIIKCNDEMTKKMLIKLGFKFMGAENINGKKVYLFTNPLNLKEPNNDKIFKSNRLYF